jgi:MFS transporter, MHS family, proline/betaine transporter
MSKEKISNIKMNTAGGIIGNILEWYDFAVFGYFVPVIGAQFFPSEDKWASLLSAFGVFAAGYMMRPIGGIIFGHIGDKFGRKRALQLSVMMMAIPTMLVGFLPTFAQIGVTAAVLLVILRLIQGVSVGGELIGSITFVSEIAPEKHRGLLGSLSICSATAGVMLGSAVATIIHWIFTSQQIHNWAWRIPFIAGIIIGLVGIWMRRRMIESPDFEIDKTAAEKKKVPLVDVLKNAPGRLITVFGLAILGGGGFYMAFIWWPTYLTKIISPPIPHALLVNTVSMVVLILFSVLGGYLSDFLGRRRIMFGAAALIAITAYPLFILVGHGVFIQALIAQISLACLLGLYCGIEPAAMAEQFSARNRYTGIAVGYNTALAIFGGTTPLICTWLVRNHGLKAPVFYLIGIAVISLIAVCFLRSAETN